MKFSILQTVFHHNQAFAFFPYVMAYLFTVLSLQSCYCFCSAEYVNHLEQKRKKKCFSCIQETASYEFTSDLRMPS
jgi:hypothetical protein